MQVVQAEQASAIVRIAPGRVGPNTFEVRLTGDGGEPLAAEAVRLHLGSRHLGIAPIVRTVQRQGDGLYRYEGAELVTPGAWEITARARVGDFDLIEFHLSVEVAGSR